MSAEASDTGHGLAQFVDAYTADWPDARRPEPDSTTRRRGRRWSRRSPATPRSTTKGCTPPDSLGWTNRGNNEAFLAQRVVMTVNPSLSIPGALRATRPEDYYRNAITIDWPSDAYGRP